MRPDSPMQVFDIDQIDGRRIEEPGFQRILKEIFHGRHMTAHLGIIFPGQASSCHQHDSSEEFVYVVSGVGEVTVGKETSPLKRNVMVYGPPGIPHQYRNTGSEDLVLFVVYSPPTDLPSR